MSQGFSEPWSVPMAKNSGRGTDSSGTEEPECETLLSASGNNAARRMLECRRRLLHEWRGNHARPRRRCALNVRHLGLQHATWSGRPLPGAAQSDCRAKVKRWNADIPQPTRISTEAVVRSQAVFVFQRAEGEHSRLQVRSTPTVPPRPAHSLSRWLSAASRWKGRVLRYLHRGETSRRRAWARPVSERQGNRRRLIMATRSRDRPALDPPPSWGARKVATECVQFLAVTSACFHKFARTC